MCVQAVKPSSESKQRYKKANKHLWPDRNLHWYRRNIFMRPTTFSSALFVLRISLTITTLRRTEVISENVNLRIFIKLDYQDTASTMLGLFLSDAAAFHRSFSTNVDETTALTRNNISSLWFFEHASSSATIKHEQTFNSHP